MTKSPILKTISLTLCVVLLTFMVGRPQRVFAMAAEVLPDILPVYEADIINFQDYCDNNLTGSQMDIVYLLLGAVIAGQAGSSDYKLQNPFATESGVLNWLKSCGIEFYNTMVGLGYGVDPSTGIDIRPYTSAWLYNAMGIAQYASKYASYEDFIDDLDSSENLYLYWNKDVQFGLNSILALQNGLYNWQFSRSEFTYDATFVTGYMSSTLQEQYLSYELSVTQPVVRCNYPNFTDARSYDNGGFFSRYHNLFINGTTGKITLVDDNGNTFSNSYTYYSSSIFGIYRGNFYHSDRFSTVALTNINFNPSNYSSIADVARAYFNNQFNTYDCKMFFEDFITNVYYGTTWSDKVEIHNDTDLNFAESLTPYYLSVQQDTLLDIRGLLTDLINVTDLYQPFIDNIYFPNGTGLTVGDFFHVSVDLAIPESMQTPALPVNLNDIADYTDNDYLKKLEETAKAGSSILRDYTVFWYNVDSELVYLFFGSFIIILVAAFVGKWGHS